MQNFSPLLANSRGVRHWKGQVAGHGGASPPLRMAATPQVVTGPSNRVLHTLLAPNLAQISVLQSSGGPFNMVHVPTCGLSGTITKRDITQVRAVLHSLGPKPPIKHVPPSGTGVSIDCTRAKRAATETREVGHSMMCFFCNRAAFLECLRARLGLFPNFCSPSVFYRGLPKHRNGRQRFS